MLFSFCRLAHADKIDDLCRALTQDPSYKVRVQAALVLGKLADRRSLDSLKVALHDENESVRGVAATALGRLRDPAAIAALRDAASDPSPFVRGQAQKALAAVDSAAPPGNSGGGARVTLTVGFQGKGLETLRSALSRELARLPNVRVSDGSSHERGYLVDGTLQRLSARGGEVDCDVKAFVATYPDKAIKMMTTEGASLQVSPSEVESAKRDCLTAAVEAVRDDVGKFLRTVQ